MDKTQDWVSILTHGGCHQICSFMSADCWILSHSEAHLEPMMKDFIEEAGRWDLDTKQASLWWTITYADENMEVMMIKLIYKACTNFRSTRSWDTSSIRLGGRRTAWKRECIAQGRPGEETGRFTRGKFYRGDSNAGVWWMSSPQRLLFWQ